MIAINCAADYWICVTIFLEDIITAGIIEPFQVKG